MATWLQAVPALLLVLTLLALPGGLVVAALRLRGLPAVALAPAFSVSIIAVSAIVGPWLGMAWNWRVPALGTAVVLAGVLVLRRFVPAVRAGTRVRPVRGHATGSGATGNPAGADVSRGLGLSWEPRLLCWALAGALLAAAAITARLLIAANSPGQITENYDTVFHLNAVWYALDNGNASSFFVGEFVRPGASAPAFYPGAWHGIVSLVVQLSGVSIAVATNITWLASAAFIWPPSVLFLTRALLGPRVAVLATAGVLSAGFAAFPYLLLYYGSAYPNGLSNALTPTGVALLLMLLRRGRRGMGAALTLTALILYLPGMALAQPNGLFSIVFLLTPLLLVLLYRWLSAGYQVSARFGGRRSLRLAVIVLAVAALLLSNRTFRGLFHWANPQTMPFVESLWRGLANFPTPAAFPPLALTALVLFGLYRIAVRGRQHWLIASVALCVLCYGFATGMNWAVTNALIAPWYGNPERIAALLPLLAVPLAAAGLQRFVTVAAARLRRGRDYRRPMAASTASTGPAPRATTGAALASMALAVVVIAASPALWQMDRAIAGVYTVPAVPDKNKQLDTDELALLRRLDDYTDPGDVLANNPWNGSALAEALADREVLFPYMSMSALDADRDLLRVGLDDVARDPLVCAAAHRLGVDYLLDFGDNLIAAGRTKGARRYPGIDAASSKAGFRLVARVGHAKLFKLPSCAPGGSG